MSDQNKNEKTIFMAALRLRSAAERETYLRETCWNDKQMQERVKALLEANDIKDDFLEVPAYEPNVTVDSAPITEGPGKVIGRYKLLEKIGEGGMALVYLAEQEKAIRRKVALKIIKLGMDTRSVIARFEAERQALALMDHPNIAKVLDAGATETGRPYFVMDFVPGLPITQYCDKNRLSIKERLKLFISVCNAVQHAHQKGIIHRDIKPSNIIVTQHDGKPVPKVIDFGIAKATNQRLTEKTLFTRHAHIIGTPAYMSPEQAELSDLDVDTRTDIYSLGILLYELLTGSPPFSEEQLRRAGYLQMQKIICEKEPAKPSTKLSTLGESLTDVAEWHNCSPALMPKLVRGDLDWIVMKSLEKDRTRRYDTVSALVIDVHRHLNNEAVEAAAPSISYKSRKFLKHHRVIVATSSVVAAALVIVAVISAMYAVEAERAKREIAETLAGSYIDQAQTLCEQGHVGRGMLWLAHSLEIAPERSDDLKQAIRTSLSAWHGQLHSLRSIVQYPEKINKVVFSPDGSRILAACQDGTIRFCDAATGQQIGKALNHGSEVIAVAVSPNDMRIATGGKDGLVRLWNAVTLEPVGEPMQHGEGLVIAFSTDDSKLITGGNDCAVRLWDVATSRSLGEVFQYESESLWHSVIAVSSCTDGIRAVLRTGRNIYRMFDVESGEPIGPPVNPGRMAFAVAISPDGKRFLTGDGGGTIRVWNAATGEQAQEPISHGGVTYTLAFSPDGSRIVSGGASRLARLWDVSTGVPIGGPMRQRNTVTTVAFSPDSARLVTGNQDGVVELWDLVRDRHVGKTIGWPKYRIIGASFVRNSLWVLEETEDTIQLKNQATGEPIGKPFLGQDKKRFVTLSPDGSCLVTQRADFAPELFIWDVSTGQLIGELYHQEPHVSYSVPTARVLLPEARTI